MGGGEVRAEALALLVIRQYLVTRGSGLSETGSAGLVERDLLDVFANETVPFKIVVPLPTLSTTLERDDLDDGLELAPLLDDEERFLATSGFLGLARPGTYALRARTRAMKVGYGGYIASDGEIDRARAAIRSRYSRTPPPEIRPRRDAD